MKRIKLILVCLVAMSFGYQVMAQYHVFSVGGRFGGNGYQLESSDPNLKAKFGVQAMGDLAYTYYGDIDSFDTNLGFKIGVSAGWGRNHLVSGYQNSFVNYDYEGREMDYTVTTDNVTQTIDQFEAEVSFMLAFRYSGVCVNAGIKGLFPFKSTYKQKVNGLNIDAYYPEYDVHVTNELITGMAEEDKYSLRGDVNVPRINLEAGIEFGYEFELEENEHALGILGYVDYCFWNNYEGTALGTDNMITVDPISDPNYPVPNVNIGIISESSVLAMNHIDVGVKLYYRFSVEAGSTYSRSGGHRYMHRRL